VFVASVAKATSSGAKSFSPREEISLRRSEGLGRGMEDARRRRLERSRGNTEVSATNADVPFGDRVSVALVALMESENALTLFSLDPRPRWLDRQGFSTLFTGGLLLLISFTTNYGDDNLLHFVGLASYDLIGVGLHLAALAALAGDVQLATCLRHRDARSCSVPIPPPRQLPQPAPTQ